MNQYSEITYPGYQKVMRCENTKSGLNAFISVHDTTLGPALGGLRIWSYTSEEEALTDVLRLSKGMTYKASVAGLQLGGGKAVIIGDSKQIKSPALLQDFGEFVDFFQGHYITAEDVGSTEEDMDIIATKTAHVRGLSKRYSKAGNPSPITAYGVYKGMKSTAKAQWGSDSLKGKTIAVQGVGNVSYALCSYLHAEGAKLVVTDINPDSVARAMHAFGAQAVDLSSIYSVPCDIFSPNALGGVLTDETIPLLQASIVAGAANNVLLEPKHGQLLHDRGILYAPDYVINAGGVIHVAHDTPAYNEEQTLTHVEGIYDTLTHIFDRSKQLNLPPSLVADLVAEERVNQSKIQN